MIRRLVGRWNHQGWSVARIRFVEHLAGGPAGLFASLSAKWLGRSSTRSIRVARGRRFCLRARGPAFAVLWAGGPAWRAVFVGRYSLTPGSLLQIMPGPAVGRCKALFSLNV